MQGNIRRKRAAERFHLTDGIGDRVVVELGNLCTHQDASLSRLAARGYISYDKRTAVGLLDSNPITADAGLLEQLIACRAAQTCMPILKPQRKVFKRRVIGSRVVLLFGGFYFWVYLSVQLVPVRRFVGDAIKGILDLDDLEHLVEGGAVGEIGEILYRIILRLVQGDVLLCRATDAERLLVQIDHRPASRYRPNRVVFGEKQTIRAKTGWEHLIVIRRPDHQFSADHFVMVGRIGHYRGQVVRPAIA